jgi:hypothetical protein
VQCKYFSEIYFYSFDHTTHEVLVASCVVMYDCIFYGISIILNVITHAPTDFGLTVQAEPDELSIKSRRENRACSNKFKTDFRKVVLK